MTNTNTKNTALLIAVVVLAGGFMYMVASGEGAFLAPGEGDSTDEPVKDAGDGAYEYDVVLTNFNAYDGAGSAVNPTGYAYIDEKPSEWGDEYEFEIESGAHESTKQVSFSDGAGDVLLDAGKTYYYHFKLDGYQDSWREIIPPEKGDYRPIDMKDSGIIRDLTLKEYDTTAITSSAMDLGVSQTKTNNEIDVKVFQDVADNKVMDPAKVKMTNVRKDDVDSMTLVLSAGGEEEEIDIVTSTGSNLEYAGTTDKQVFDSDDYSEISEAIKDLSATSGEEIKVEVEIQADTEDNSDAPTEGDGILETDSDGTASDDETAATITVLDQEENKLINAQDITA